MRQSGGSRPAEGSGWGCCLVIVVLALVIAGSIGYGVWSFVRPDRNEKTLTTDGFAEACEWPRDYFPRTAAYRGRAPHPIQIAMDVDDRDTADEGYVVKHYGRDRSSDAPAHWNPADPSTTQLVACLKPGRKGRAAWACRYLGVPEAVTMYEMTYKMTVYESRTAEKVGEADVRATDHTCPDMVEHPENRDAELYTLPTTDELKKALARFTG